MWNLYSVTKGQQAIRELAKAMRDTTGNLPPQPAVFPDYTAPIVRSGADGRGPRRWCTGCSPATSWPRKPRLRRQNLLSNPGFWEAE